MRLSSSDASQWTHIQTGKEGEIYRAVAFGNGRFAAVGSYGGSNIFASTADGESWDTSTQDARYVNYLRGIGFGKDEFFGLVLWISLDLIVFLKKILNIFRARFHTL